MAVWNELGILLGELAGRLAAPSMTPKAHSHTSERSEQNLPWKNSIIKNRYFMGDYLYF